MYCSFKKYTQRSALWNLFLFFTGIFDVVKTLFPLRTDLCPTCRYFSHFNDLIMLVVAIAL